MALPNGFEEEHTFPLNTNNQFSVPTLPDGRFTVPRTMEPTPTHLQAPFNPFQPMPNDLPLGPGMFNEYYNGYDGFDDFNEQIQTAQPSTTLLTPSDDITAASPDRSSLESDQDDAIADDSSDRSFRPSAEAEPKPKRPRTTNQSARKGRSFGNRSSKPVRNQRARAEAGCIQTAVKLGWAEERITRMYNKKRIERGENVDLDTPINDPKLVAQIDERKKRNRHHQHRRTQRLAERAYAGDVEIAKKLKWSDRRIAKMQGIDEEEDIADEPEQSQRIVSLPVKVESEPEQRQLPPLSSVLDTLDNSFGPPRYPMLPTPEPFQQSGPDTSLSELQNRLQKAQQAADDAFKRAQVAQDYANWLQKRVQEQQPAPSYKASSARKAAGENVSMGDSLQVNVQAGKTKPRARAGVSTSKPKKSRKLDPNRPSNFPRELD